LGNLLELLPCDLLAGGAGGHALVDLLALALGQGVHHGRSLGLLLLVLSLLLGRAGGRGLAGGVGDLVAGFALARHLVRLVDGGLHGFGLFGSHGDRSGEPKGLGIANFQELKDESEQKGSWGEQLTVVE
jgi:hypothetical protein